MSCQQPITTLARRLFQRPSASEMSARIHRFKTRSYVACGDTWVPAPPSLPPVPVTTPMPSLMLTPAPAPALILAVVPTAAEPAYVDAPPLDVAGRRFAGDGAGDHHPSCNGDGDLRIDSCPALQCAQATDARPAANRPAEPKRGEVAKHRAIAVPVHVMSVAGDTAAGILLSQLIYWTRHGTDVASRGGWVFKTASDWQRETGMSWKVQHRARRHLLREGLIEERRHLMPARIEFRLKLATLADRLGTLVNVPVDKRTLQSFSTLVGPTAELLMGRPYLYFSLLATVLPMHSAMLCSRLLLTSRMPNIRLSRAMDVEHLASWADTGHSLWETVRMVRMHRDVWREQTGLTRDQWQTARRNLRDLGVLVERQHNFPRRVDLGVDMHALAKLLHKGADREVAAAAAAKVAPPSVAPSKVSDRPDRDLDRVKQMDGSKPCAGRSSESPNPAFSNRPILPPTIARSCPHLYELQELQQPPPQRAARATADHRSSAFSAFGWGGGDGYEIIEVKTRPIPLAMPPVTGHSTADAVDEAPATSPVEKPGSGGQNNAKPITGVPANPPNPGAIGNLGPTQVQCSPDGQVELDRLNGPGKAGNANTVWPAVFSDGDRQQAMRYAVSLDREALQQVLDEIGWLHSTGRPIRSPVALLRTLCDRARNGAFAPDGAHRIAAARRIADNELRRKSTSDAITRDQLVNTASTRDSGPTPEVAARLAAVKAALNARRAA